MEQEKNKQPQPPIEEEPVNAPSSQENVEVVDDIPQAADQVAEEQQDTRVADLETALEKEKKEYLFLMAEFDNFRKRTVKEKSEIIRNASETALKGLLPIVDDFERALAAEQNPQAKEGMELIYQKLIKYLATHGVKAIDSTGQPFDPDLHEAIAMVPTEDEAKKGKVIDTPEKGYTINDKVLRHAKVAVGQ